MMAGWLVNRTGDQSDQSDQSDKWSEWSDFHQSFTNLPPLIRKSSANHSPTSHHSFNNHPKLREIIIKLCRSAGGTCSAGQNFMICHNKSSTITRNHHKIMPFRLGDVLLRAIIHDFLRFSGRRPISEGSGGAQPPSMIHPHIHPDKHSMFPTETVTT